MRRFVDILFTDVVVPLVNDIFGNGFPFPTVDGLQLANSTIMYGNQFITLGSDFTYTPTAGEEGVRAQVLPIAIPEAKRIRGWKRQHGKHF